jgi:hypothetical protein
MIPDSQTRLGIPPHGDPKSPQRVEESTTTALHFQVFQGAYNGQNGALLAIAVVICDWRDRPAVNERRAWDELPRPLFERYLNRQSRNHKA